MSAEKLKEELIATGNERKAQELMRFFKTSKGSYGEGDIFIGVTVPVNRAITKKFLHLSPTELVELLHCEIHEVRLSALICMVEQYKSKKTTDSRRQEIVDIYIKNTRYINNWDLVDLSVYNIIGEHLLHRDRELLYHWAESTLLWEQRMAIVATMCFVRHGEYDDTIAIARKLCYHPHDLIQKAVGWLLREVGKRDEKHLTDFLDTHHTTLPRTLLRYAIERFSPMQRKHYMGR
ncbi:MAG: DNA alkylation repair protein [Bacteroidaceae bacterium]|nr:DNA alkylation repair protein [Bacteroidaceae bacterium]